jgi:DNA-nicking Smr family endonuclease
MKVDLHGLRVQEATEYVQSILEKHEAVVREKSTTAGGERVLYVITGRGKHSSSGTKAKLKHTLVQLLRERGYACRSNAGVVVVPLSECRE